MNTGTPKKSSERQRLTVVQHTALVGIRDHIKEERISPTLDELAARLGVGKTAVRKTIARLRRKGMLAAPPGQYRNLIVTRHGKLAAARPPED